MSFADLFAHLNKLDIFYNNLVSNEHTYITHPRMQSISYIEKSGKQIYNNCQELRDISTVMEHPEMYSFYLKYMKEPKKLHDTLILMRLYEMISKYMYKMDPQEQCHNAYHKLTLLYKIKTHPVYSRILFRYRDTLTSSNRQIVSAASTQKKLPSIQ